MAGNYTGPGHRIVSGETPTVGLRVLTNEYKWGTIVKVDDPEGEHTCGYYCEAWHDVKYDASDDGTPGRTISMNCDRLTTKEPRNL